MAISSKKNLSQIVCKVLSSFPNGSSCRGMAYKLLLLTTTRIYLVFYVSQLKKATGNYPIESKSPPNLKVDVLTPLEPEAILSS